MAGAEELLTGYDTWRKEQSSRDVDVSPIAYLHFRRSGRALVALEDSMEEAEELAGSIEEVLLVLPGEAEGLRPLLLRSHALCRTLLEAAAWE